MLRIENKLSFSKVLLLNFIIMLSYMTIFNANSQGNDYISMGEAINKQRIVFYIQLFLNLVTGK